MKVKDLYNPYTKLNVIKLLMLKKNIDDSEF